MNKYIQQFLDDNDLQAGEKFYILDKDHEKISNELFYINKNFEKPEDILKCASRNGGYSYNLLCLLIGRAFIKKKPFYPKYGEMVYYVTVSGYIQEVRFDTDSTLHQLLRKAGKLYRSEEEDVTIRQNALQCIYELTNKILDMQVKDKYLNPIVVDINQK